jgi:uncharacterized protein YjbJ (UPF0337 family)
MAEHHTEDLRGQAKEGVGKLTGDEALERQGKTDQAKADVKEAADSVKDKVKDVFDR